MNLKPVILSLLFAVPTFARLNVVTTTADFGAIAREVGGENVKVSVLARPTEDPHFVDPKPSFVVLLNRADLLIEGGVELEGGWLPRLIEQSRNPRLRPGGEGHLAANKGVQLLGIPAKLDRSEGDIHAMGNPHYLVDPENAKIVAHNISVRLCELDPKQCAKYQKNEKEFLARLDKKIAEWKQKLAPFAGRHLAAYHDSWPYFGRCFDLKIDIFLEPKPGIPPSPAHLAKVIEEIRAENAKAIFCEPYLNHKTAERVARETMAKEVDVAHFPGGIKGVADDYISLIDSIVNSVAEALKI